MSLEFTTAHRTEDEMAQTIFYLIGLSSLDTIILQENYDSQFCLELRHWLWQENYSLPHQYPHQIVPAKHFKKHQFGLLVSYF